MARMKWYVATIIMTCRVDGETAPVTCDEQIRLIRAVAPDIAYQKAIRLGHREEHAYLNAEDRMVRWEFSGLSDLDDLFDERITDGVEIRSRLLTIDDPAKLITTREKLAVFLDGHPSDDANSLR